MTSRTRAALALAVLALAAAACSEDGTPPGQPSVLAGMAQGESNDTTGGPPPTPNPTPGSFSGYVLGPGTGPDTMATAPRIAGTTVTLYPHTGWKGTEPTVGPAAGTVTTNAEGYFAVGPVPGGEYVVTFVPPTNSIYRSVYVLTTVHQNSNTGTWWVVLPKKQ